LIIYSNIQDHLPAFCPCGVEVFENPAVGIQRASVAHAPWQVLHTEEFYTGFIEVWENRSDDTVSRRIKGVEETDAPGRQAPAPGGVV
jgi:hypothetical protein